MEVCTKKIAEYIGKCEIEICDIMGQIRVYKKFTEQEQSQNVVKPTYLLEAKGENMKGITYRADGRYMIRRKIDGETVVQYARTFARAKEINKELEKTQKQFARTRKQAQKKKALKKKGLTFEQFANKWLETYKKPFIKPKSYSEVKSYVKKILLEFGECNIKQLNALDIQEYLNKLPKGRTKEKIEIQLNAILQKAVDLDILQKNPFNAVVRDKKQVYKNDAYKFAEQQKIIQAIKNSDIEHEILIYLMCGCRPNELPDKKNFDFKNNLINVYGTKNENAKHRQIEMSQRFADYLKAYFEQNEVQPEKYISKRFTDICKEIGIEKPLLYRLRHTFATNHFTLGTPAKQVQEWMGHSSITITLDTYTDIDKTATKEKIKKLYNNFYYEKT